MRNSLSQLNTSNHKRVADEVAGPNNQNKKQKDSAKTTGPEDDLQKMKTEFEKQLETAVSTISLKIDYSKRDMENLQREASKKVTSNFTDIKSSLDAMQVAAAKRDELFYKNAALVNSRLDSLEASIEPDH